MNSSMFVAILLAISLSAMPQSFPCWGRVLKIVGQDANFLGGNCLAPSSFTMSHIFLNLWCPEISTRFLCCSLLYKYQSKIQGCWILFHARWSPKVLGFIFILIWFLVFPSCCGLSLLSLWNISCIYVWINEVLHSRPASQLSLAIEGRWGSWKKCYDIQRVMIYKYTIYM